MVGNLSCHYSDNPVLRALLQLVPYWGCADTLLEHRAAEIRSDRIRVFFEELANGTRALTEEIIQEEDFLHNFFCTLKAAINTRHREKIRLFARLLSSSISPATGSTTDEFEELLGILDDISLREFIALNELAKFEIQNISKESENKLEHCLHYWEQFRTTIIQKLSINEEIFNSFMAKIERTGLYFRLTNGFMDYRGNVGETTPLFKRLLELVSSN